MSLLALDLGTNMGYAINSNGVTMSGSVNFKPGKFDGGGIRFLKFRRWLDQIHAASPITEVCYEAVRAHTAIDAAHIYGALMGVLQVWCEEYNVPYSGVAVSTIKKFAAGKGNASKDEVIAAVKRLWGFDPKSSDEADAIALLHFKLYEVLD
jgi:Holliday junction resolvasome RuvABC endonuclease subunit